MKIEDIEKIVSIIDDKGFDYGLTEYGSCFTDIEDKKFQRLLAAYQSAHGELEEYIGELQEQLEQNTNLKEEFGDEEDESEE